MSPQDVAEVSRIVNGVITPHDRLQDGLLAFMLLVNAITGGALIFHLRDHRRWREIEDGGKRRTGSLR